MINNNLSLFAVAAILLLLLSFSSPSVTTMAQPQTGGATTTIPSPSLTAPTPTPSPPLTPEEQEEQTRLQNVIAATNQNLDEAEKEVNGIVYTPRWSDVVWVEPGALSILIAYCLPGEFAESGQEILGGFELEVLESYEIALPQNFMAWMMVIGNEDRQDRLPAAVGVICASDTNDVETRVLSPDEEQQINNVVQQFTTIENRQITSIDQVINIINNATTPTIPQNGNTTTPTTPPTTMPPGNNNTTNTTGGADTTPPVAQLTVAGFGRYEPPYAPAGRVVAYSVEARDIVDGYVVLTVFNLLGYQDNVGGDITIACNPPSGSVFPFGDNTVQCTATDASGNRGTYSFTVHVISPPPAALAQEQPPAADEEEAPPAAEEEEEQPPPVADEGAAPPPTEEEPPAEEEPATPPAEEEEAATTPPVDNGGG